MGHGKHLRYLKTGEKTGRIKMIASHEHLGGRYLPECASNGDMILSHCDLSVLCVQD